MPEYPVGRARCNVCVDMSSDNDSTRLSAVDVPKRTDGWETVAMNGRHGDSD